MSNGESLLGELCRICHVNPPKYCCPRCSTKTCSLPCTKRHKLWAQCSGVRNPAAYVKRADLATPRGIDRDYNFITGIERGVENAERDAERRGTLRRDQHKREKSALEDTLERAGVYVHRAPKGMSRNIQNKTRWHKKEKRILWTIEWVFDDGRKELSSSLEILTLAEAFVEHEQSLRPVSKKRRRQQLTQLNPAPTMPDIALSSNPGTISDSQVSTKPRELKSRDPSSSQQSSPALSHPILKDDDLASSQAPDQPPPPMSPPTPLPNEPQLSSTTNFYLHAPYHPQPYPHIIPLSSSATLANCLRHRTLLEFPSIYALSYPPQHLPDRYILIEESTFSKPNYKPRIVVEAEEVEKDMGKSKSMDEDTRAETDVGVDLRLIADMLSKDLHALGGGL